MPTKLTRISQEDFSVGAVRATARHLIPPTGYFDAQNLMIDQDGSLYKRGGCEFKSDAPFGTVTATNLVVNPSFEVNVTDGWTLSPGATGYPLQTTDGVFSGTKAAKVRATSVVGGDQTFATSAIAVTAGLFYQAAAWITVEGISGSATVRLRISWYDGASALISDSDGAVITGLGGRKHTVSVIAPGGAVTAKVAMYLDVQPPPAAVITAEIDAVQFHQAASLPVYFDGSTASGLWTGTAHNSTSELIESSGGMLGIWDNHYSVPGQRTLFANNADFGVLDTDDTSPLNIGGNGVTGPVRAAEIGNILFVGGGHLYAGSRKTAVYSTGTVSTTNGSPTVTGAGTTWNTLVDTGMLFRTAAGERVYTIQSIDSTTQITLTENYEGTTGAGKTYSLSPVISNPGAPYKTSEFYATAGDRLCAVESSKNHRVVFSAGRNPTTGFPRPHSFAATDHHEFPEPIIGLAGLRDILFVFTTKGFHAVSRLSFDLTDPAGNVQHRVEQLSDELVLWGNAGITQWRGALVIPGTDNVWLVDGISSPQPIASAISPLIEEYAKAGAKLGQAAVHDSHYIVPVLDASNNFLDMLVCKLDRPLASRTAERPWTRLSGYAADVAGLASRVGTGAREMTLLAASRQTSARILDLTGMFSPTADNTTDADGTFPTVQVGLRRFDTGDGRPNLVRRFRAWYELEGNGGAPTVQAYYGTGERDPGNPSYWGSAKWGTGTWGTSEHESETLLEGNAPVETGHPDPFVWPANVRARRIHFKLMLDGTAERFVLRGVELWIRPTGRI